MPCHTKSTVFSRILTHFYYYCTQNRIDFFRSKLLLFFKSKKMKVHFIAIGGSVMHNLAIALHQKNYQISGSDDEIYEPAKSRLQKLGLLPQSEGWFPEKISSDLDAVVLGMHARKDNPELAKAKELGLKIYSFPEYLYEQSLHKERVVVAGSHGKTTTTAMIIHVLKHHKRSFDFAIGAYLQGFESTVSLSDNASVMVMEGDEYLTSPLDLTPKFLHYNHHIALITGIAWDHINVYPDYNDYVLQFKKLVEKTPKAGVLIYCEEDTELTTLCKAAELRSDVLLLGYQTHPHIIKNDKTYLITADKREIPLEVFGKHNMQNIGGAKAVCMRLGITENNFYEAIQDFTGAAKRLELVKKGEKSIMYRDFAHAPSKVIATIKALKEQYPQRKLVVCTELHTFSSLNKNFLPHYRHATLPADHAVVFYSPHAVAMKRLEAVSEEEIKIAFDDPKIKVFTNAAALDDYLMSLDWQNQNLLMMSSGTFDNTDFKQLAEKIIF